METLAHITTVVGVALICAGIVLLCVWDAFRPETPARPYDQERDERASRAALRPRGGEVAAAPQRPPVRSPAVASRHDARGYARHAPTERERAEIVELMRREGLHEDVAAAEVALRRLEQRGRAHA